MNNDHHRIDFPVILLYNLDPSWPRQDILDCRASTSLLLDSLAEVGHPVQEVCIQSAKLDTALKSFDPNQHLIFNWCEELPGIPHSAYRVAKSLDQMGFTYTGSNADALELSQDKRKIKDRLQNNGIPTPPWQFFTSDPNTDWAQFPAIVKPAYEHCSFGITSDSVVQSTQELKRRICFVLEELQQPAIVEDFIDGREFHVGVIGNGTLHVLPPAEIDYSSFNDIHDRLCTYEANFDKTSLSYQYTIPKLPAVLTKYQLSSLEQIAIAAYRATDCRDYARMDIRLRNGTFYILDVNHNADISPDTSLVKTAEMAGYSYGQFGSLLINLAAQRHARFSYKAT
jgi:D-alanine-D-alanine ligase